MTDEDWTVRKMVGAWQHELRAEILGAVAADIEGILISYQLRLFRLFKRAVIDGEDTEAEQDQARRETVGALLSRDKTERRLLTGEAEGPRQ